MSLLTLGRLSMFGGATLLTALALAPAVSAQAKPAPTHDALFDVGGSTYSGGTTFAVDKTGKVAGTMKLNTPALVDAKLNGEVKNGVWKFNYPFTMNNQGQACSGMVWGTAKVNADGSDVSGSVSISGDCAPDVQAGTFAFKKRAK